MGDRVTYDPSLKSLLADLSILVRKGDTVLVKASHFMDFGKVVKALQEPHFVRDPKGSGYKMGIRTESAGRTAILEEP